MAVAAYTATLQIAPSTVIHDITTYELPFKMDMVETTAFSSATPGTKTFLPTLLGMEVKASGFWNKTDTGQQALETAFFGRTKVSLIFKPDGGSSSYSCSCWISDYAVKAEVKGVVTADFTLTMDGGVTIV